jgi:hypothetical protein
MSLSDWLFLVVIVASIVGAIYFSRKVGQEVKRGNVRFIGKDEPCFLCGEQTYSTAGNPHRWPIWLGYPNGNGKTRCYCTGCVISKVNA